MVAIADELRDPFSGRLPMGKPRLDLSPHYRLCPQMNWRNPDPKPMFKYRRKMLEFGYASEDNAALLWRACREDVLFFINTFCYLFEPRTGQVFPFDTYGFQDYHLLELHKSLIGASSGDGKRYDTGAEKSRDLGYTWMVLTVFFHWWLFRPRSTFRCTSKDVKLVDELGNEDTLFWKLEFQVEHLPSFLKPDYTHSLLRFLNHDNNSSVIGYASTEDAGTGGRCLAIMMDEFAKFGHGVQDAHAWKSTQHITRCRIPVGTFKGSHGTFHHIMREDDESSMKRLVADWKNHPTRSIGMYQSDEQNNVTHFDDFVFPGDYKFIKDGKKRSPYYDEECNAAGATPAAIAEELDRDPEGSSSPYFSTDLIKRLMATTVREPTHVGYLDHERNELELTEFYFDEDGPLKLWIPLAGSRPNVRPSPSYSVSLGCDVAAGTAGEKSSNSTIIGWNQRTGEQVLEYASNSIRPDLFADLAIALAHWLNGAFLNWECNGPTGSPFTRQILARGYHNIYYRQNEMVRSKKKSKTPGWMSNGSDKATTLQDLQRDADVGRCKIRSRWLLKECGQYIWDGGKVVHIASKATSDESAKGEAHGDRVIGAAVGWIGNLEREIIIRKKDDEVPDLRDEPNDGSLLWRIQNVYEPENEREEAGQLCVFASDSYSPYSVAAAPHLY